MNLFLLCAFTTVEAAPLWVIYSSFFEWTLHRYVMHREVHIFGLTLRYPFEKHEKTHHRIFKADESYHLLKEEDKRTIPMEWWNAPVLVAIGTSPALIVMLFTRLNLIASVIYITGLVVMGTYYGIYERMHWCMHLPKKRGIERTGVFFRLNGHHLLHHRYMHKNFNVVLPFADLCLGTLLLRSKFKFKQATGPSVPDVQPRVSRQKKKIVLFEMP